MLDAAVDLLGRAGQQGVVEVQGASMMPTFRDVPRVAVEFEVGDPSFGDVLVFRQRGILVVHRLIGRGRRYRMRGDGTIGFDPWLEPSDVVGRVLALEQGERWIDVRGPLARLYGRAVAFHNLFWGGLGAALARWGGRVGDDWRWRLGRLDQFTLRIAHALFFRLCHRDAVDIMNPSNPSSRDE